MYLVGNCTVVHNSAVHLNGQKGNEVVEVTLRVHFFLVSSILQYCDWMRLLQSDRRRNFPTQRYLLPLENERKDLRQCDN